ncbi:MAG: hypothetical protein KAJ19_10025, partial [Gammaproteobacteria bacterium]|nr:hypothetical protein [Gammaproteobacteria bacterium]
VSDGEIKEAMKDVDIVTTAPPPDCLKLVQDMGEGSGHTIYDSSKWGVIQSVNSGAGLDVASLVQSGGQDPVAINPDVEKIYGYQIHEPPLSFDHEIKGDMIRRDFACNSLYYDPVNRVMIDPTGTGIADAQNKVLRLSPSKEEGMKNDMLSLRYYKFRMRGYSSTQDTLEYMSGHFHKHMSGTKTSSMINMLHRVLQKEKTPEIALDKLRTVMFADGHGHLYNKFIKPKYNIIVQGLQAKKLKQ